jgi:hypothetical protein
MKKLAIWMLVAFSAAVSFAQVTTSSIGGTILAGGNAVDNASVKAVLTTTNAVYETQTRQGGSFDIFNLQAGGPYTVTVSAPGQKTVTVENVYLILGENYKLDLDLATALEKIGEVSVITSRNSGTKSGANFNLSSKQLNTLPTINRSIDDFTKFTPQAGGNNSFNGRDGRFNNITIDGANFNNNFGLSTNNMPGGDAQPISLDAIEAVQVNVSPYDVRQSNFTGAGVNAITRSGSNKTEGSIYTFFRNESMNGTKVGETEITNIPPSTANIYGFRLGGAIKKDKVFYFVNFEQENRSFPGLTWEATDASSDPNDANLSRVTKADLDAVRAHLKSKYNYETGDYQDLGNFATANTKFLGRIDWNISQKHKFSARYNYVINTNDQVTNGTSAPTPRSTSNRWSNNAMSYENSLYNFTNTVGSLSLELKSNLNSKMSNQLLVTGTQVVDARGSNSSPFPFVDIKKDGDQYISFGYELFSWNNKVINNTYSFIDNFTYNTNKHTLTAGVAFDYMYVGNSFMRYGSSYYRYDSLSQFLNDAQPSVFAITYGYNGNKNPIAELGFGQAAAYVQDEYRLNKNFKLIGGLRLDLPIYFTEPLANVGFDKFTDASKPVFKNPEGENYMYDPSKWPTATPLISPRVGFNYDVKGDKSLVVRGGTGIFTGRLPFVWYTNQPTNAYGLQSTLEITKKADLDKYGITQFEADPTAYFDSFPPTPAALPATGGSYALVDPKFNFPQVWRTSLGVDFKLPGDIDFTADIIYTKSVRDIYQYDANMKPSDTMLFQGTEWERAGYSKPAARTYTSSVRNAIVLANTNQGSGLSFAATLSKTFKNGFNTFLSYSINNTRDITANPGSQAASAFQGNAITGTTLGDNQNTPYLSFSQYSTPHRVVGGLSYKFEYAKRFATTVSLTYAGFNAGRFNYTYSTDINNDGIGGNDLIFIHESKDIKFKNYNVTVSGQSKTITAEEQAAAWDAYVAQDAYLSKNVGQFADRYAANMPWLHRFDLAIYQDIAQKIGKTDHKLQLSANILNIGNMINSSWGIAQQLTVNNGAVLRSNTDGTYQFNAVNGLLPTATTRDVVSTSSTWGMQLGVRYLF